MNAGRRMLIFLAVLFLAPLALSFYMYYGAGGATHGKRVNHGELLMPARPIPPMMLNLAAAGTTPPDLLRHKWTLLYVGPGRCELHCVKALYDTRQVRLALDRDMGRVQRLFLAAGECCDLGFLQHEHPDLIVARLDAAAAPLLAQLPNDGLVPLDDRRIYVIDPLSNLVLDYAPDAPPKGLLEDMKRLLRLSQIG